MSVSLKKNEGISLKKGDEGLKKIKLGVGWDQAKGLFGMGRDVDVDAALIIKSGNSFNTVSFSSLRAYDNGKCYVQHSGDNLTGAGKGEDEVIEIFLNVTPSHVEKMALCVNVYRGAERNQHFGMIKNAFVNVYDENNNKLATFNLTDNYKNKLGIVIGEITKGDGWEFKAVGEGYEDVHAIADFRTKI